MVIKTKLKQKSESRQARVVASRILAKVFEDQQSLATLMPLELDMMADPRERALAQALCFGVIRHYYSLNLILSTLLEKKLKKIVMSKHLS